MKKTTGFFVRIFSGLKTAVIRANYIFAFTRRDRRVIGSLSALMVFAVLLRAASVVKPAREWLASPEEKKIVENLTAAAGAPAAAGQTASSTARTTSAIGRTPSSSGYTPPAYMQKKQFTVDLNRADTFDLQEIRGIGPAFARRIVQHRERLGGFTHLEQLREVWGVDSAVYQKILPQVYLKNPRSQVRKIDINTADIKTLKSHPYLDYYQAKEIYLHRVKNGPYKSVEELQTVNLIDGGTYRRISPYLYVPENAD